jgi:hypothetical protein
MHDPVRSRRRARDAGLAAVNRWTRRAVAGGVVLSGLLGAGLAHLLPGQAAVARHDSPAPAGTTSPAETTSPAGPGPTGRRSTLAPPSAAPRRTHHHPHATSGGS